VRILPTFTLAIPLTSSAYSLADSADERATMVRRQGEEVIKRDGHEKAPHAAVISWRGSAGW
jgi:hypothetical protein